MTAEAYRLPDIPGADDIDLHRARSISQELGKAVYNRSDSIDNILEKSAELYKNIHDNEDLDRQLRPHFDKFYQGVRGSIAKKTGHYVSGDDDKPWKIKSDHYNLLGSDMVEVEGQTDKVAARELFEKGLLEHLVDHLEDTRGLNFGTLKENINDETARDKIIRIAQKELGAPLSQFVNNLRNKQYDGQTFKELYRTVDQFMQRAYSKEGLAETAQIRVADALQRAYPEDELEHLEIAEKMSGLIKDFDLADKSFIYRQGLPDWLRVHHDAYRDELEEDAARASGLKKK